MNKITLIILVLIIFSTSKAQSVQVDWIQSSLSGAGSAIWVDSDSSGNAYVGGVFSGTLTLGNTTMNSSTQNIFVAKYDYNGA